ncbi:tubulin-tyrosine ligase family protein [Stylonychia lemnae]|uniref:Tubulin-tyrosine ligase family protein n=1 Tax=Stylonychia lemnae TaxID=5949 RepID=A0A078BFA9_STYLE|nr:tubulin-tyrosine ligase family protein [Stylonychia lemnae]|eukprot:CDW91822.1 tubulin-tyrosine ligase family protein [Stylonychia lemnae]
MECVKLELHERKQIDDVINFFTQTSEVNALVGDDDQYENYLKQSIVQKGNKFSQEFGKQQNQNQTENYQRSNLNAQTDDYQICQTKHNYQSTSLPGLPPIQSKNKNQLVLLQLRHNSRQGVTFNEGKIVNPFMDDYASDQQQQQQNSIKYQQQQIQTQTVPMSRAGSKRNIFEFMKNTLASTKINNMQVYQTSNNHFQTEKEKDRKISVQQNRVKTSQSQKRNPLQNVKSDINIKIKAKVLAKEIPLYSSQQYLTQQNNQSREIQSRSITNQSNSFKQSLSQSNKTSSTLRKTSHKLVLTKERGLIKSLLHQRKQKIQLIEILQQIQLHKSRVKFKEVLSCKEDQNLLQVSTIQSPLSIEDRIQSASYDQSDINTKRSSLLTGQIEFSTDADQFYHSQQNTNRRSKQLSYLEQIDSLNQKTKYNDLQKHNHNSQDPESYDFQSETISHLRSTIQDHKQYQPQPIDLIIKKQSNYQTNPISEPQDQKMIVIFQDGQWIKSRADLKSQQINQRQSLPENGGNNKNQLTHILQQNVACPVINQSERNQSDIKIRPKTNQSSASLHNKCPNPQQFIFDSGVIDYSQLYKSFYDIFMIPHIQNRQYSSQKSFIGNIKDLKQIIVENQKLYSTFSQLIYLQDNDDIQLSNFQGIQGGQLGNQGMESRTIQAVQIKQRYQKLKQNLSIQNFGAFDTNHNVSSPSNGSRAPDFRIDQLIDLNRQAELYFRVVKEKPEVYDIITLVFGRQFSDKWKELPHGVELTQSWNLLWTWSKIKSSLDNLLVWQRFNHYPENKNITRKDLLKKNIEKVQKICKKSKQLFDIIPMTFILPQEYTQLLQSFHQAEKEDGPQLNYWIVKPPGKSRGRGIHVVNDTEAFRTIEPLVVQKYLKNPFLLNGHKFDMRIYVLVTSFNPLECFIYKEGLARFSTVPFSLDPSKMSNRLIHLTNYSVQKTQFMSSNLQNSAGVQVQTDSSGEKGFNARSNGWIGSAFKSGCSGSKLSLSNLRSALHQKYVSWESEIWPQVKEIVLKTLIAGSYNNQIPYNPCAFELYGYDIIIDSKKKCWLIEVNSSPSLATDSQLDEVIKRALIKDTISVVDPVDFDRKKLADVLLRRLNEYHNGVNRYNNRQNSQQQQMNQMNRDITYILNGKVPRQFGQMPMYPGNYEMIAPSPLVDKLLQTINQKDK